MYTVLIQLQSNTNGGHIALLKVLKRNQNIHWIQLLETIISGDAATHQEIQDTVQTQTNAQFGDLVRI